MWKSLSAQMTLHFEFSTWIFILLFIFAFQINLFFEKNLVWKWRRRRKNFVISSFCIFTANDKSIFAQNSVNNNLSIFKQKLFKLKKRSYIHWRSKLLKFDVFRARHFLWCWKIFFRGNAISKFFSTFKRIKLNWN